MSFLANISSLNRQQETKKPFIFQGTPPPEGERASQATIFIQYQSRCRCCSSPAAQTFNIIQFGVAAESELGTPLICAAVNPLGMCATVSQICLPAISDPPVSGTCTHTHQVFSTIPVGAAAPHIDFFYLRLSKNQTPLNIRNIIFLTSPFHEFS